MKPGERVRLIKPIVAGLARLPSSDVHLILYEFAQVSFHEPDWNTDANDNLLNHVIDLSDDVLLGINEHLGGQTHRFAVPQEAQSRIWKNDHFRLFLSHLSTERDLLAKVDTALESQGVDGFVAHADIPPSREWAHEIELALRSCHACAAFLHPKFPESPWTEQEVGFCLGRGLTLVPVRFGLDPYGLMGKFQGIQGLGKTPLEIAIAIVEALIANEDTQPEIAPIIVRCYAAANSPLKASNWMARLERVRAFSPEMLQQVNAASITNPHVAAADGVSKRVATLLERHGFEPQVAVVDYGEEPF
jgi:hypothetical protein